MADEGIYVRREQKKLRQLRYSKEASFEKYIREMVQIITPRMRQEGDAKSSISTEALAIADSIILDLFQDLAKEARKMVVSAKRRTLMACDIQCAVLMCLRGEVARHAVSEAQKAVFSYVEKARRH
ncbi:hypothetical protein JTE90_010231 [Oedothorax gibbosus]|uniref:Core Histone H2A/H2B/H3 domain-containing protein n=1 Tax=Oedothorax gibbosus TaxID=931172 RepID=A0AAV6TYW6_9ARAC|nr:hypothetical protein JTE90_010231 [Oedothorax gibbosus]